MPETLPPRTLPLGAGSAAGWWAAAGFAMVATMSLLAFFGLNQRFHASATQAQVQSTEFDLLTRTLETESLLADQSLAQLQQALTGQTLSALAIIELDEGFESPGEAAALLWSDKWNTGYLMLPPSLAKAMSDGELSIIGSFSDTSAGLADLTTYSTSHPQIIGLQASPEAEPLKGVILTLIDSQDVDLAENKNSRLAVDASYIRAAASGKLQRYAVNDPP